MGNVPFHGAQPGAVSAAAREPDETGGEGAPARTPLSCCKYAGSESDVFPSRVYRRLTRGEMSRYVKSEQELLNAQPPFADPAGQSTYRYRRRCNWLWSGIAGAAESPPPKVDTQTCRNTKMLDMQAGPLERHQVEPFGEADRAERKQP